MSISIYWYDNLAGDATLCLTPCCVAEAVAARRLMAISPPRLSAAQCAEKMGAARRVQGPRTDCRPVARIEARQAPVLQALRLVRFARHHGRSRLRRGRWSGSSGGDRRDGVLVRSNTNRLHPLRHRDRSAQKKTMPINSAWAWSAFGQRVFRLPGAGCLVHRKAVHQAVAARALQVALPATARAV